MGAEPERDEKQGRAVRLHAPRMLTAWVLGVLTQLVFSFAILSVAGEFHQFLRIAAPTVVVATLLALPLGLLLERLTRALRVGAAQSVFLVSGMALGFGGTYTILTVFPDTVEVTNGSVETTRIVASVFMLTSVGAAFFLARAVTDVVRRHRTVVFLMVAVVVAIFLVSIAWYAGVWS